MASTVTLGPSQSAGDVQATPITIGDDLASIVALKKGIAQVSFLVTGAPARIGLSQSVAQGDARVTTNYIDIPAGSSWDVKAAHCGRNPANTWQIVVSNVTNGAAPVISPVAMAL